MAHSFCRDSKVYIIFKWIRPLFTEVWQLTRLSFFLLNLTPLPQIHCGRAAGFWIVRVEEQNCLPLILTQSAWFPPCNWNSSQVASSMNSHPVRSLALDTQCFVLLWKTAVSSNILEFEKFLWNGLWLGASYLSYLSHYCTYVLTKASEGEKVCLGLGCEKRSITVGESWLRSGVGGPIAAAIRKHGEMNAGAQLPFSPFQRAWDPDPWDDAAHC